MQDQVWLLSIKQYKIKSMVQENHLNHLVKVFLLNFKYSWEQLQNYESSFD